MELLRARAGALPAHTPRLRPNARSGARSLRGKRLADADRSTDTSSFSHSRPRSISSSPSATGTDSGRSTRGHGTRDDDAHDSRSGNRGNQGHNHQTNNVRTYKRRVPLVDLYAVLNVPPDATTKEINGAWKKLQKSCHPDVAGAYAEDAAALLNEARLVLVSASDRQAFDHDRLDWLKRGGTDQDLFSVFDNQPLSKWSPKDSGLVDEFGNDATAHVTNQGVFVDESHCIGCIQCAAAAPNTFRIEQRFGRARVVDQWADSVDDVLDAIEICPVQCIHSVPRSELPVLERVTARLWRERTGGGVAAKGTYDASPFEIVNALRRRADPVSGLAPWPSRRRRVHVTTSNDTYTRRHSADGSPIDTSAASEAIAEAVRAANARDKADQAEANEFRNGQFTDERVETNTAELGMVFVNDNSPSVFSSNVISAANGGDTDPDDWVTLPPKSPEVERLHRMLKDARNGGRLKDEAETHGDLWKLPDFEDRVSSSGSFESLDEDDFAPSEWIANVRLSRGRAETVMSANAAPNTFAPQRTPPTRTPQMPRAVPVFVTALALAAGGIFLSQAPVEARVISNAVSSGISETGGWVEGARASAVLVNGVEVEWVTSTWVQFICATTSWFLVLSGASGMAESFSKHDDR